MLTVVPLLFQETTVHHFRTVRLKPEHFTSYLTEVVGFSSYRLLTHTGINTGVHTQIMCMQVTQVSIYAGINSDTRATLMLLAHPRQLSHVILTLLPGNQRLVYLFHKGPAQRK